MAAEITQDDIDQQNISQLHSAVLECSKNCFELKKLCATVLGSSLTLIATFTTHRLDNAFFFGGALIVLFFWTADAQSFFYQEKIRARMKSLQQRILSRHKSASLVDGVGMPLSVERQERTPIQRVVVSLFNWSMLFYYGLFAFDLVLYIAKLTGLLRTQT